MIKYDPVLEKCKICGSYNIFKFHEACTGAQIFKCGNCRIQFMNPQYTDIFLANYYSSYIRDETHLEQKLIKSHTYCLSIIEGYIPSKGNLLDVGSGNGYLIKAAKDRGWQTTGHEINCLSANILSTKTGIRILCGELFDIDLEEKYDAVTMLHVLEHLKEPEKYIQKINGHLKKNGIFFIALPNIQSRSSLFKLFLEKMKLKKKNVAAYYDTEHHLLYFSPFTIRKFLKKNGFEIIRIYSGENINLNRSSLINLIDEKVLSKLLWHSSMSVISRKL